MRTYKLILRIIGAIFIGLNAGPNGFWVALGVMILIWGNEK